jgi:hypothetical protein
MEGLFYKMTVPCPIPTVRAPDPTLDVDCFPDLGIGQEY